MNPFKSLVAAAIGTTAMTLFSYASSNQQRKQWREPELLSKFIQRTVPDADKRWANVAGWTGHYSVGLLFCLAYDQLWTKTQAKPTWMNSIIIGGVSGVIGAAVWRTLFKVHPDPPKIDRKDYEKHLLAAHEVFSIFAAMGYKLAERTTNVEKSVNG
jgi:hypothetical protein